MADEVLFEFLHSELVSYVLANSEKDKTVINKCHVFFFFVLELVEATDCAQKIRTLIVGLLF
jgi:hypothetical protein